MKEKINKNLYKIIPLIFTIISICFMHKIISLNIIPSKYIGIILVSLILITLVLDFFIIFIKNKIVKIIFIIISILISVCFIYTNKYLSSFDNFIELLSKSQNMEVYYTLVVKNEDSDNFEDYINTDIGVLNINKDDTKKYLNNINFSAKFEYQNLSTLHQKLVNNNIRGIIIPSGLDPVLRENDDYKNYKFIPLKKIKIDNKNSKIKDITKKSTVVYISGIDVDGSINTVSRSDVNIIAVVNPEKKKIFLLHIPRDTLVKMPGTSEYDKLTHTGLFGSLYSAKAVEDYFNIEIDNYIKVNFNSVTSLLDLLGGVEVTNSEESFKVGSCHYPHGTFYLSNKCALGYVRERKSLKESDISRGKHQLDLIVGVINKVKEPSNLLRADKILNSMNGLFTSNLTEEQIKKFIKFQIDKEIDWEFEEFSFSVGEDIWNYRTYTYPSLGLYVMKLKQNELDEANKLLKEYIK